MPDITSSMDKKFPRFVADGTVIGADGVGGSTLQKNDVTVAKTAVEAGNGRKFATARARFGPSADCPGGGE